MKKANIGPVKGLTDGTMVDLSVVINNRSYYVSFPYIQIKTVIKVLKRLAPPIKISSRKEKGRRLQKYFCEKLSEITGIPWGKDKLIESREMGQSGVDVKLIGHALKEIPFSIECKNQEKWCLPGWVRQAKENQLPDTDWILCTKSQDVKNPVVIMDADTFFKLFKVYHDKIIHSKKSSAS